MPRLQPAPALFVALLASASGAAADEPPGVVRAPSPASLLEEGERLEKAGATASAWGTYHRAEARARTLGEASIADEAAKRANVLDPRLSRMRIVVAATDTQVELDERVLGEDAWRVPLPLDPGTHRVSASVRGRRVFSTTLFLSSSGGTTDVLVLPPTTARSAEAGADLPAAPVPEAWRALAYARTDVWSMWIAGIALASVGGVAVVGGVLTLTWDTKSGPPEKIAGAAILALGAAMGGGGLGLAVVARRSGRGIRSRIPFDVSPVVGRTGGGLSLHGAF